VTSFFGNKGAFFGNKGAFLENGTADLCQIFLGFKRKHLFITTCIEKHCIQPLKVRIPMQAEKSPSIFDHFVDRKKLIFI